MIHILDLRSSTFLKFFFQQQFLNNFPIFQDGTEDVHSLTKGNRNFNPLILFIPAMCDMTATSIMYVGLNLTYASSFQMFRGEFMHIIDFSEVSGIETKLVNTMQTNCVQCDKESHIYKIPLMLIIITSHKCNSSHNMKRLKTYF